jgi:hypothetical protein
VAHLVDEHDHGQHEEERHERSDKQAVGAEDGGKEIGQI